MNKWISIAISALSDFVITAGTAFMTIASAPAVATAGSISSGGSMVGSGGAGPTTTQIIVCLVGGLVAAARGAQKTLSPPPT